MADTLNFGPEWLRALSDGNNVGTPPPSPSIPGKYKLADYRYGREEMLALNNPDITEPSEELKKLTAIYVEKAQEPLSLQSLSEEEQRLMSQSVNSTAVLRMFGRGGPPGVRGGRGGTERGRGRGRGRGEGFLQRGMSAEEGGGFGRPPSHSRSDGWEEVGPKRNYQSRFDDSSTGPQRQFHRSLSNENWRDRGGEEEEEDGDWRKAGSKWGRGNWREPINRIDRGGFDSDRHQSNGIQRGGFDRDKGRSYQRNRISESWDEDENLPEWSMPDTEGNDVGTFDSSGAFVSTKKKPGEKDKERDNNDSKELPAETKKDSDKNRSPGKPKVDTKEKVENKDKVKTPPPQVKEEVKQNESKKTPEQEKNQNIQTKKKETSRPAGFNSKPKTTEVKDSIENNSAQKNLNDSVKNEETNVSLKKEAAEAETLARLQEAAENVVLSAMTAEDEEKPRQVPDKPGLAALPVNHEDAFKWWYKDPQGDMQGPFTSEEMTEWFSAGYFTMNLQVKRGCDEKISPLGEIIKTWGRVPFLPGPLQPPPILNTPPPSAEETEERHQKALQQLFLQQQILQQQFLMRQLQMQQMQQVMQQLQENEHFKNLSPLQQQQLAMQMMAKQQVPIVPQSQIQKLSPSRSPPIESVAPSNPNHPAFHRSVSQPNTSTEEVTSIWDTNTKQNLGGWSQPTSQWDLDPNKPDTDVQALIARVKKEKDKELEMLRQEKEQEERRIQEDLKRQYDEMLKQQEELRKQRDEMERQKIEIEKQRQLELQRFEEVRRRNQEEEERQRKEAEEEERRRKEAEEEERRRKEEEMWKEQEMRQKQEEAIRRKREEEMRREEELRQKQLIEQQQKQREMEERQKQQEAQRRQEEQRQQELQRQKQQQEALKRLQQEQMANIQLPQHAQWANQQAQAQTEQQKAKSLLEIQEQEERERQKQEEIQRQLEAQRQQMLAIQQQQQQQKSWTAQGFPSQSSSKSLIEIQEEQARQLELERQRKQQQQQTQAKNLSISAASAWSGVTSSSHWASEGAWGNQARNIGSQNGSGSLGFWDDAIISSKRAPPPSNKNMQGNPTEFPTLKGGNPINTPSVPVSKTQKPSKMKKEEEAVQRLFKQPKTQENDFSQWCEKALKSLDTSVDIPTFIAFLTEVESPYEVHDYVRSYLGETKASKDFAKQFLEKRSQSRNKAKPPVVEESIWGPAPARDYRQPNNQQPDFEMQKNKGGKKKKKMMKIDSSILGFTVSADPERKNVGELEEDLK